MHPRKIHFSNYLFLVIIKSFCEMNLDIRHCYLDSNPSAFSFNFPLFFAMQGKKGAFHSPDKIFLSHLEKPWPAEVVDYVHVDGLGVLHVEVVVVGLLSGATLTTLEAHRNKVHICRYKDTSYGCHSRSLRAYGRGQASNNNHNLNYINSNNGISV